jgi:hypothetical protein
MGNPRGYRRACRLRNLELDRSASFLLKDEGAGRHALAVADVACSQLLEIACTEFAIDSQIEEGEISASTGNLKSYANRPYLLEFEGRLFATSFPLFHGWRAVIAVLVSMIGSLGWELPVCGLP